MKEKGSHYLEPNFVVCPTFKCTHNVIFPNQVFVTKGNGESVKPEINKLVEEDNKKASKDGFFSNQSIIENNMTKNSYTFPRKKPSQTWIVKTDKSQVEKQTNVKVIVRKIKRSFKEGCNYFSKCQNQFSNF